MACVYRVPDAALEEDMLFLKAVPSVVKDGNEACIMEGFSALSVGCVFETNAFRLSGIRISLMVVLEYIASAHCSGNQIQISPKPVTCEPC